MYINNKFGVLPSSLYLLYLNFHFDNILFIQLASELRYNAFSYDDNVIYDTNIITTYTFTLPTPKTEITTFLYYKE